MKAMRPRTPPARLPALTGPVRVATWPRLRSRALLRAPPRPRPTAHFDSGAR